MRYSASQKIFKKLGSLPGGDLWVFGVTQLWAGLFGLSLAGAVLLTHYFALPWWGRYDWLFVFAVLVQLVMVLTRLQKPSEVLVVAVFYVLGLGVEVFNTSATMHIWRYPDSGALVLGGAPLFAGFLYAAIGSYLMRSWRIMRVRFTAYPRRRYAALLAFAIYASFFAVPILPGLSYVLLAMAVILFWRTRASCVNNGKSCHIPFLVPIAIAPLLFWLAEKFAAFTGLWVYLAEPSLLSKCTTWLLLLLFSCILANLFRSRSTANNTKM